MLVRFDEDGQEQEMVVPSNWVKGNILFYPNSIKTKFLFKTRAAPGPNWKSYSVTKVVVTGDKETCDNYEFATSCDESLLSVKSAKKNTSTMKKPVPPKLTVTMSSPCFPVENQSPKRTKEVVSTDESDEDDFEVFPTRSKLKQVPYSGTSSESDSDEGSSHPKINEAVTKSRILAESARGVTKRKYTKCARDKFPMEEGEWQYRVYKISYIFTRPYQTCHATISQRRKIILGNPRSEKS